MIMLGTSFSPQEELWITLLTQTYMPFCSSAPPLQVSSSSSSSASVSVHTTNMQQCGCPLSNFSVLVVGVISSSFATIVQTPNVEEKESPYTEFCFPVV